MIDHAHLLRESITNKELWDEPWTSGVVSLSGSELTLCVARPDGLPSYMNLAVNKAGGEKLPPVAFGRNRGETFGGFPNTSRNSDATDFSWLFHSDSILIEKIIKGLFPWGHHERNIRLEPYKLNISGKGSCFKAHQGAWPSENRFGSLIFVLPYIHCGGNFILRHQNKEHIFDSSSLLRAAPPNSAAFIAFYSNVRHEALEVTSGYRVTVTFNLYFDPEEGDHSDPKADTPLYQELPFKSALQYCLSDPAFLRGHQNLGFGLERSYPTDRPTNAGCQGKIDSSFLQEPDATIYRVLKQCGFSPEIKFLYCEQRWPDSNRAYSLNDCGFRVIMDKPAVEGNGNEMDCDDVQQQLRFLLSRSSAWLVRLEDTMEFVSGSPQEKSEWLDEYTEHEEEYKDRMMPITWVTDPGSNGIVQSSISVRDNVTMAKSFHYQLCLVVNIHNRRPGVTSRAGLD